MSKPQCANCKRDVEPHNAVLYDDGPWCLDCVELREDDDE